MVCHGRYQNKDNVPWQRKMIEIVLAAAITIFISIDENKNKGIRDRLYLFLLALFIVAVSFILWIKYKLLRVRRFLNGKFNKRGKK